MSDWDDLTGTELDTLALVEQSLPPVTPPDDLLARILERVQPGAVVVPLQPDGRRHRRVVPVLGAVLAAGAVVALAVSLVRPDGGAPVDGRAAIAGTADPSVTGAAVLHGAARAGGSMELVLRDVPSPPAGHHYEVWVLRAGSANMEPVGSFTPASGDVQLDLQLPAPGRYTAVDVSVEEDGGRPAPSTTILASGTF